MMMKLWTYESGVSLRIMHFSLFLLVGGFLLCENQVKGHGRLIEPPSRSSMFRYGFNTTANYNDHELYCGGYARQQKNGGRCGVCGDAWDLPKPRPNEAGGTFGQGIIVRKYRQNSIIRIKVELTANHKGYFEFRLCPNNNPKQVASQKCLDKYLLEQASNDGPRYFPGEGTKVFESRFLLPKDLTCIQCVLQWRYIAGNNWGKCSNGTEGVGCGPQEEFRACSDVAILDNENKASAEGNALFDDDDKYEETTTSTTMAPPTDGDYLPPEPVVWPFVMALCALVFAALAFGAIVGWFYRKEVLQFARDAIQKHNWKMGMGSNTISQSSSNNMTNMMGKRAPVPPPRTKRQNKDSSGGGLHYDDKNGQRRLTPDIISHPLQVTINGLAV